MNIHPLKRLDEITLEEIIFKQLRIWLLKRTDNLSDYKELWSVAPRRGVLNSKVWIRKEDQKLVVLKSFDNLRNISVQKSIINEIVVPIVVDSPKVLKPRTFFIENEVNFYFKRKIIFK